MTRAAILLLMALALAGCGNDSAESLDADALPLIGHPWGEDGDELHAEIQGTLRYDATSGCVLFEGDGKLAQVILPVGTEAERSPFEIELPDGTTAREGDFLEGGGGWQDPYALDVDDPNSCLAEATSVAVFNGSGDIAVTKGARSP